MVLLKASGLADGLADQFQQAVVYGAEEGAKKIDKLRESEEKHAKSLKGLKKQAKDTARAEVRAARDVARAQKEKAAATEAALKTSGAAFAAMAALSVKAAADLESAAKSKGNP